MLLTPLPLSQTVTPSRTPSPSSVTYFMDGPCDFMRNYSGSDVVALLSLRYDYLVTCVSITSFSCIHGKQKYG